MPFSLPQPKGAISKRQSFLPERLDSGQWEMTQMRIVSTMAVAFALGGALVAAPGYAAKKEEKAAASKATPAVHKAAFEAQKAAEAGDIPTALTNYNTAKAAIANDDDKFMVGQIGYSIYQKNKDDALQGEAIDLMVSSGKAPPETQAKLLVAQGQIAYNKRDYPKALTALQAAQAAGAPDSDIVPMMVEAYAASGQTLQALKTLDAGITKQRAANQPVPIEWFQRGIAIGYRAKANPTDIPAINNATLEISKQWVAADPQKKNWSAALQIYQEQFKLDNDARIDVFRLMRAAGVLSGVADYREYADLVYLRFPNEAMQVLQEGNTKGIVNLTGKSDASDVMGIVKGKVAADKASLAGSDKAGRAAADSKASLTTADAYVTYGMYPQALDLYKVAATKGADAGTVALHTGWALALSGDNAGAKAAFQQVTGTRKPIADMWLAHLDHPTVG
jgi:tetratricopeptide (TPR) repeat protein